MKKLLAGLAMVGALCAPAQARCISSYECPPGHYCIKTMGQIYGECVPDYQMGIHEVTHPLMVPPDCTIDTDCPTGWHCCYGECKKDW